MPNVPKIIHFVSYLHYLLTCITYLWPTLVDMCPYFTAYCFQDRAHPDAREAQGSRGDARRNGAGAPDGPAARPGGAGVLAETPSTIVSGQPSSQLETAFESR